MTLPRRPRGASGWAAWALLPLALIWLLRLLWSASITYWYLALPALAVIAFGADRYWRSLWAAELERRQRVTSYSLTFDEMRDMHWRDFEIAIVHLMRRDGIAAEHTGKAGDFSGDVIGYDPALGERWMVQVKHYNPNNKVKSDDVQKVAGAAWHIYEARLKLVVTTSGYTRDALAFSAKAQIHLIDKAALIRWATDGVHLHDVLGIAADTHYGAAS
ncbi:restriction endonuclease [Actinomadura graeca]|uniref:Restriction endonuclease n=1 Tax=Actinomadura graeca TaxID=2750812 RepID=A0ABX8R0L9_9ACTN|nr:restriction endonuclease [Actinomadura graeca]QXJ23814.1 restriction endonuclease [Actinomadura graeca]